MGAIIAEKSFGLLVSGILGGMCFFLTWRGKMSVDAMFAVVLAMGVVVFALALYFGPDKPKSDNDKPCKSC